MMLEVVSPFVLFLWLLCFIEFGGEWPNWLVGWWVYCNVPQTESMMRIFGEVSSDQASIHPIHNHKTGWLAVHPRLHFLLTFCLGAPSNVVVQLVPSFPECVSRVSTRQIVIFLLSCQ